MIRKTLIGMTVALAAASMTVTSAQAKGKGFGIGVGVGLLIGGALLHRHHHRYERPVIVQRPIVVQPVPQRQAALPVIRTSDDMGRIYDVASRTWFDGRAACWTGPQGWTFRGGSWLYGTSAWFESNGVWQTNAAQPPVQVDCATVPAFAAKLPKAATDKTAGIVSPGAAGHGASPADVLKGGPEAQPRLTAQPAENGISSGGLAASIQ